jgi:threonine dehydrogenase-like Zn-dependent dehydrogenase
MSKAIIFEGLSRASFREIEKSDIYLPTAEEQAFHGVNVITRPEGDPAEGELQVEAVVGSVCTHEVSIYRGELTVPRFPWIAGHEAVHRVTKVGKSVKGFHEGDLVSCCWYHGQWSRRICGPAKMAYLLPEGIKDPELWIIEPAASVVNAANYYGIKPGDRVLLIGAGYMGLLHIQLLSQYPLSDLVVSEVKETSRAIALRCGATEVVDPVSECGAERLKELEQKPFDIVVECSGAQDALDTAIKLCTEGGRVCLFAWHRKPRIIDLRNGHLRGIALLNVSPGTDAGHAYERHWPVTIRLHERGIFDEAPLITHRYDARDIETAMEENAARTEGFIKSAVFLE